MTLLAILLWSSLALVAYVYMGYPLLVWILSRCHADPLEASRQRIRLEQKSDDGAPSVSLVIAAFREETVIIPRLLNALLSDYPGDRLEIIVGCDGNEDLTGELVRSVHDPRVRLVEFPVRRGKASVLNDCVPLAKGDIIVFSDANTLMDTQAIRILAGHFADPSVGCVCGRLDLIDPATGQNVDGLYWKFETFLKRCEARLGALLGVNGGIYAIRKSLYEPIPANTIIDDFLIGMKIVQQGSRLLYDERAVAIEDTPPRIQQEFHRRARIGAGGFQALGQLWPLLNPFRGWIAWTFFSHKVLRWCCPVFLIMAWISNLLLIRVPFYDLMFVAHTLFYVIAVGGLLVFERLPMPKLLRVPSMFVSMNAALLVGFFRWARGIRGGTWKRTERTEVVTATNRISNDTAEEPVMQKECSSP